MGQGLFEKREVGPSQEDKRVTVPMIDGWAAGAEVQIRQVADRHIRELDRMRKGWALLYVERPAQGELGVELVLVRDRRGGEAFSGV